MTCRVMGVLNVTPDSFSDGGRFVDPGVAVAHGEQLFADGADLVDVGGESTRPGALRVSAAEELRRVLPVVRELAQRGVAVSIDTTRATVAAAALDAGATVVNDVSGGLQDPAMAALIADAGVEYVVMHWRAPSREMHRHAVYDDVVLEVRDALAGRVDALARAGVDVANILLDPGLGFAKTAAHNWELLDRLDELLELGRPLLFGASRKSFLGPAPEHGHPDPRDAATAAISARVATQGVHTVRVHDVRATVAALGALSTTTSGGPR